MSLLSSDDAEFDEDTDAMFHGGVGVRYWLKDTWGVRGDARILFPPSSDDDFATTDWEFTVGVFKYFGKKDAPPPPPGDTDGDGLTDDVDKCPNEPEDLDNFQDDDGCPENDNDQDGIPDANDKCPDTPEDKNGIDDEDGCPEEDTDGDGLLGSQDQCPNEPEDKDGFQDEDGCPDNDNDGDGIPDSADKCVNEPETVNQFQDEDGCPDEVPKEVEKFSGKIEGIKFALGKAKIRRSSFKVLDEAVAVLQKYPDIKLEVQGHTDSTGSAEINTKLSQARAQAVVDYMVGKGVDAGRLTAKGYGPDKPVADNKTKAGRAQNRRVEFVRQ
jgi:OOP family OmpA-OmpF porin